MTTGTRAAIRPASPRRTRNCAARLDPIAAGRRLANYLKVMTLEAQTIARACGKNHVHNLEPEDLCALTIEAAAMAGVPLAGTNWIPGKERLLTEQSADERSEATNGDTISPHSPRRTASNIS